MSSRIKELLRENERRILLRLRQRKATDEQRILLRLRRAGTTSWRLAKATKETP
ncbi:MAG: hypothetical protein WBM28_14830 [Burkholderiales bacterium]